MTGHFVIFRWEDSAMHGTEQRARSECDGLGLVFGISAGIVVREDHRQITIAQDAFPAQAGLGEDNYRQISSYPRNSIEVLQRFLVSSDDKHGTLEIAKVVANGGASGD